tara:strand:+ start:53014 stop:54411 length:1398 start_codon:yes stop_codon:yes gene_type:complete
MIDELIQLDACTVADELKAGNLSPKELVDASERRINQTDHIINAIPTKCFDRARSSLKSLDKYNNPLNGIPIVIKDLMPVSNVLTTYGSKIFSDNIPDKSDSLVNRIEKSGGVIMGKSNTPEFGAGANTFNEVFGATLNPWDISKTCGGSSGGSAVSIATGQVWLAHGSDLGGSLRTPASFCGITGLRPSPGRVPTSSSNLPFSSLFVDGPMGRNAKDVALFLDAMCGFDTHDPLSYPKPEHSYRQAAEREELPKRIAYSPNLGFAPVDKEVSDICEKTLKVLSSGGAKVELASPNLQKARESFHTLRAAYFAADKYSLLDQYPDILKPELVWNIKKGLELTAKEIGKAEIIRANIFRNFVEFFDTYDLLVCPTAIVPPFDVNIRYIENVGDVYFDNYVDWIAITFVLSLSACPIVATPAGITKNGLPVGLQILAPPKREDIALSAAAWLESQLQLNKLLPIDPT